MLFIWRFAIMFSQICCISIKRVTSSSSNNSIESGSSFSEVSKNSTLCRKESIQKPKQGGTGMMKWKCTHKKSIKLAVKKPSVLHENL